jgi:adenine-specific DNA-methyltransferase
LSGDGSIFVHLDWHVGAYVKIALDEIFGRENFVNEIIWRRAFAHNDPGRCGNIHDTLYYYQKSKERIWNKVLQKPSPEYIEQFFDQYDPIRKERYNRLPLDAPRHGSGGNLLYEWKGAWPAPGRTWACVKEQMEEYDRKGIIHYPKKDGGKPRLKRYESEFEGVTLQDLWIDINKIHNQSNELLDYPTQKPTALLDRIIRATTNKGSLVADFFSGSGTTAAVAEKLGRRWIASDLGKPACMITRKRLIDQDAKPFLYQHIGDYQVEQMRSTMGAKFRVGDLAEIVLGLFGALPLPPEENPNKNMGRLQGSKTLVLADSPNKMTGLTTLKRAIEIRDNLMGGWDRVIVLGWNFSPTIGHDIEALGQGDRLEVLVIPPDLLDRLKKKGHKLKADDVRFSSLQYLKLGAINRERAGDTESLSVSIANYVLLSPEALNLAEANREKLQEVINKDPLTLIEYWSVDPDYDGNVFRSVWQDYRGNADNDGDAYRVVKTARLTGLPTKEGARRVCVRVVDVFGFEAEATIEVA